MEESKWWEGKTGAKKRIEGKNNHEIPEIDPLSNRM